MLCQDLMKSNVKRATVGTTVAEAAACMRDERIGFLPVCDPAGNVIGTLTDRDIAVRVVAENRSPREPVEQFMTRDVVTCRGRDDLSVAQELMSEMQVSRIVCLDEDGRLEGVLSLSDLAQDSRSEAVATLRDVSAREA